MTGLKGAPHVQTRLVSYDNFMGMDASRDAKAMDSGKDQFLATIINGYCDWRGQICKDKDMVFIEGDGLIQHVRHYDEGKFVWAYQDNDGINLTSTNGFAETAVYAKESILTSTVMNQHVHIASRGSLMRYFDGAGFHLNPSPGLALLRPAYAVTCQKRLCVAGIPGFPAQVHISRVDDPTTFPSDEDVASTNVLRAGIIDVGNLLGTNERITGLSVYEQNRLCIFTEDRVITYIIDPDIDQWRLDSSTAIHFGTISHNSIQPAGKDLLFCSRSGIHSIQRSSDNGLIINSIPMSEQVKDLYRQMVRLVDDPKQISAVVDRELGIYHVFFPIIGTLLAHRLSMTIMPAFHEGFPAKFSIGDFLNARCGTYLGGDLVFGTSGGLFRALDYGVEATDMVSPDMTVVTPYLWHGSLTTDKQTHGLVIQASGRGVLDLVATDLDGRGLGSINAEIDNTLDDGRFYDMPLSEAYERPWEQRYKAAQYTLRVTQAKGLVRINGLAVAVRK